MAKSVTKHPADKISVEDYQAMINKNLEVIAGQLEVTKSLVEEMTGTAQRAVKAARKQ